MGKIDTSGWKEFSVCKLFGNSRLGKYHSPESLVESETGYPYICASNQNNGVNQKMSLVSGNDVRPTPQNIISWGKQCPYFTFHEEPCVTGQGMYYIVVPKYIPRRAIRYVITVLQSAVEGKFGYSDCFIGSSMDDLKIKLPSTTNGDPDWAYMESYMANLETKVADSLTMLQTAKDVKKKKVDTREWGEFKFGDLFDLRGIKQAKSQKLIPTVELSDGIPCVPYIVQSQFNNMVGRYVDKQWLIENNEPPVEGNALVLGVTLNACSYQPEEFGASQVITARSPCLNKNNGFFITAIVRKEIEQFDYKEKPSFEKYRALKIMLPMDKTGQPDWAYMEEYMRKVGKRTENMLNQFVSAKKDCENGR